MSTPAAFTLSLDLGDGLPEATVHVGPKPVEPSATKRRTELPSVAITSTPTFVVASYADVHCLQCGGATREFRGTFLESALSNGVRVLQRKSLRELAPFASLPRKLDLAPAEAVEICPECFMVERAFRSAIAEAQVQAELPFEAEPATAKPLSAPTILLAEELDEPQPEEMVELGELIPTEQEII